MDDFSTLISNTFRRGSVRDAQELFEICIANAFPTFHFRRLELISIDRDNVALEGRSWNHVFNIMKNEVKDSQVWEVHCHRVTMGKTPDKHVYLDYNTLGFVGYVEE